MIACPACGKEIARDAVACPHCGTRRPPNLRRMAVLAVVLILFGVVVGFWIWVFTTHAL